MLQAIRLGLYDFLHMFNPLRVQLRFRLHRGHLCQSAHCRLVTVDILP